MTTVNEEQQMMIRMNEVTTKAFVSLGWTPCDGAALARQSYLTAVGQKEALAYLGYFGRESESILLMGSYQSEGRNVLEPHMVAIPKNADVHQVLKLVEQFLRQANKVIAQTYAVALLA